MTGISNKSIEIRRVLDTNTTAPIGTSSNHIKVYALDNSLIKVINTEGDSYILANQEYVNTQIDSLSATYATISDVQTLSGDIYYELDQIETQIDALSGTYVFGEGSPNQLAFFTDVKEISGSASITFVDNNLVLTNTGLSLINGANVNIFAFEKININNGTNIVDEFDETIGNAVFWDILLTDETSFRAVNIIATWDNSIDKHIQFAEMSTPYIGDLTPITLTVNRMGTNVRLVANSTTDGWKIKAIRKTI